MSDFDRKKYVLPGKNKLYQSRDNSSSGSARSFGGSKSSSRDSKQSVSESQQKLKQPTILLKARDPPNSDELSTTQRSYIPPKEKESTVNILPPAKDSHEGVATLKMMTKSAKLIEDATICAESLQDYLQQENQDFLVIGIIGAHGTGKSTILNLLAHNKVTDSLKKSLFKSQQKNDDQNENIKILTDHLSNMNFSENEIFKVQTKEDIVSNLNTTQGVDMFVTSNRVILLDCQPFTSVAILDDLIESENKRTNLVSEFIPLENSGEIQGLQLTAFLMSVCHVLIVVQDWFFDSNVVRFIQTAEMLKPTISNPEDEYTEHYPHLVLIHNRALMEDFTPVGFKTMQSVYKMLLKKTKLQLQSNIGISSGRIINSLCPENCGGPINLFLIPEYDPEAAGPTYCGHPPLEELVKRLRANLLGATKNPLTHVQLTEKTWLLYCSKVWDTVRKSPFFVEYTKLMP